VTSGNTTVFGRGSIIDDSLLATDDVSIDLGGSLSGNGIVTGDVTNTGTVQPGDSVGLLALQGNLTQSSTGTLKIEISGSGPNDHDSLSITADATIDGTLDCSRELELVEAPLVLRHELYLELGILHHSPRGALLTAFTCDASAAICSCWRVSAALRSPMVASCFSSL